jgi:hypothetical protein
MPKVPLPERGQPLDVSYLNTIAQAINNLAEEGSALAQGNNFHIKAQGASSLVSRKLYGAQLHAQYTDISVSDKQVEQILVEFNPQFSSIPVVTITQVDNGGGAFSLLSIKDITTSSCKFEVSGPSKNTGKVGFNVIAVGVPQNSRG